MAIDLDAVDDYYAKWRLMRLTHNFRLIKCYAPVKRLSKMKEFEHDFYVHLMQTSNNFKLSAIDTVGSFISIFLSHFLPLRQAK